MQFLSCYGVLGGAVQLQSNMLKNIHTLQLFCVFHTFTSVLNGCKGVAMWLLWCVEWLLGCCYDFCGVLLYKSIAICLETNTLDFNCVLTCCYGVLSHR